MKVAELRVAPAMAVAVYAAVRMATVPGPWGLWAIAAAVAVGAPLVPNRWLRGGWWPYVLSGGTLVAIALLLSLSSRPAGPVLQAAFGALFAGPLAVAAWAVRRRESLPASLVNIPAVFVVAAFSLAVSRSVGPYYGAFGWWATLRGALAAQGAAITGGGSAALGVPPMGYVGDLVFDALLFVSLGLTLLSMLYLPARMTSLDSSPAGLHRSPGEGEIPASAYLAGGIASLTVALAGLLVFLYVTMVSLSTALLGLAVAVGLAVGLSGWLVVRAAPPAAAPNRPSPERRPRPLPGSRG